MGPFNKLDIPKHIMELPIVYAGDVHNKYGTLIDIKNIKLGGTNPYTPYDIGFIPNQKLGLYRPLNVFDLSLSDIQVTYRAHKDAADSFYDTALDSSDQAKNRYGCAAVAGVATGAFAMIAAMKVGSLINMPACQKRIPEMKTNALCLSDAYHQYRNDLKYDAAMSGAGAMILGATAFIAFNVARGKTAQATLDFVKAALSQGNAGLCHKVLAEPDKYRSIGRWAPDQTPV